MHKPDACKGCPLYDDGQGFVADELAGQAEVLLVAQNPGETEEKKGRPLVGKTGELLNDEYLPMAGLRRTEMPELFIEDGVPRWRGVSGSISLANVIRCRWRKGQFKVNDLPPAGILYPAVAHCRQYDLVEPSVKLIVASGALAWSTLAPGVGPITEWRGFLKP